jgi:hypothetical protein
MVAALAVPVCNDLPCFVVAHLRRVEQALRGVTVHHHLAADHAHVALHRLGEEGVGGGLVDRAIGNSRGRAVTDQLVVEMGGDALCMGAFDETAFLGEGVGVEPLQQVGSIGGDDLHLREMQMSIDEAGHDQMRAMVDFRRVGGRLSFDVCVGAACDDQAVDQQQAAVALV